MAHAYHSPPPDQVRRATLTRLFTHGSEDCNTAPLPQTAEISGDGRSNTAIQGVIQLTDNAQGRTASGTPESGGLSELLVDSAECIHPKRWKHADLVAFLESCRIGEAGIKFAVETALDGAGMLEIIMDTEVHEMLRDDLGIASKLTV